MSGKIKRKLPREQKINEYGNTLIDVLKMNSGKVLKRTWAMASLTKIKRRIETMTITKKRNLNLPKRMTCLVLTMFLTWQTLAATSYRVNLKTLSLSDAEELVSRINSKIPLEVNEVVLKWLNHFIGTPKGRAYMIKSLKRMNIYKEFISEKLSIHQMPLELAH